MNLAQFRKYISSVEWTFAKTYANKSPHWYITAHSMPHRREEMALATFFLNKFGGDENFFGSFFRTFYCDGWKYWTMDKTVRSTDLINRTNRESCERFGIAWTPQKGYTEAGYEIDGCVTDEEFHFVNDIGEVRKMGKGIIPPMLQGDLWL